MERITVEQVENSERFYRLPKALFEFPAHKVDKLENGNYHIFLKEKDYFYLMNPDHSEKNRYMMGTTVAK